MNKRNPKVDGYFKAAPQWRDVMEKLREVVLECSVTEELKWGKPCYTLGESNIVLIQGFKAYCALLFFKGVLMKDPKGILVKTGENTRVGRQIRFTSVQEITGREKILQSYVQQAIEIEKSGRELPTEDEVVLPEELKKKLAEKPAWKKAFEALTPGRQRGYVFYFNSAKQSKTRESRIEKCMPQILKGKGLHD